MNTNQNKFAKKKKYSVFAIIFVMAITTSFLALPAVNAHDPAWEIPTWCYIIASPNPVGVSQEVAVAFWVNPYIPTAEGAYGDRWFFEVDVTKPDGSVETLGPVKSDPVGGGYVIYTPDQVGSYSFVARFLGHTLTGLPLYPGKNLGTINGAAYVGDTFKASTSDAFVLAVQQNAVEAWVESPMPDGYWTRPIYGANREWWSLAGNWLGGAAQNVGPTSSFAFGSGPETGHILWAEPYWDGGLMDARFGPDAYYQGLSYERFWSNVIVLNGRIYYNVLTPPRYGWYAVDLYTGEKLFFHNTTGQVVLGSNCYDESLGDGFVQRGDALRSDTSGAIQDGMLSFGQILAYHSPNQHGGLPYLWSTSNAEANTWSMYDAYTGDYICSIANVSARGTNVYGKDGSIVYYNIAGSGADKRLTVWNTTHAIQEGVSHARNWYWIWRPLLNNVFDGNKGFSMDVSIPDVQGGILEVREGKYVIGGTAGKRNATYTEDGNLWALSLEPGSEGTLLWEISFTPPENRPDEFFPLGSRAGLSGPYVVPEYDVFLFRDKEELVWYGYSLESGDLIYGPTEKELSYNYYSVNFNVYEGMLLTYGYGGELRAYDISNGEVLWKYQAAPDGFEYYGFENCPLSVGAIADGKIYLFTTEHSPNTPLRRSSYLRCVEAATGQELWKVLHWGTNPVMADGYIVDLNLYDNRIYTYGKGPSKTTVSGPDTVVAKGSAVLITGSVLDMSPGAEGSPAIADGFMSEWMEYLYMGQPIPGDAVGVQVKLSAVGANGASYDIGTVTSDMAGLFKKMWTPPSEGEFTVVATFEGSKSYGSSFAETAIGVGSAVPSGSVSPAPTGPSTSAQLTDTYIIAAVVAVLVIAAAAAIMLRRRLK